MGEGGGVTVTKKYCRRWDNWNTSDHQRNVQKFNSIPVANSGYVCPAFGNISLEAVKFSQMEKTLRDELAMSLDVSAIPVMNDKETAQIVADKYSIELDFSDPIKMIDFSFKFQAIMRYQYADEMLKIRGAV